MEQTSRLEEERLRSFAFPFATRRQRAVGIRVIQELRKRLEPATGPRYSGLDSLRTLLSRAALEDFHAEGSGIDRLAGFLASRSAERFPSRHLARRETSS